jgi:hypothetical protein
MPEAPRDDAALARAKLRGKRAALGVVIVAAVAIIASSAVQIIPTVFGAGIVPIPSGAPGSNERACAEGVRALANALERASRSAGSESFVERLRPEWDREAAVHEACQSAGGGLDAWAALARLRAAEEQLAPVPARSSELDPLRRQVEAHLPSDLR